MTANQPGLIDEGAHQRLSDSQIEWVVNCAENHAEGCCCIVTGEPILREVVIEDHEGYVVVADVAP